MSVYIKGMEMPKDCGHCPLNRTNTLHNALVYECIITGKYLDDGYESQIMKSCPLVPVPYHGRLIDEVRLTMQIETAKEIQKNEQKDFCNAFINNGELCTEWWCVEDMIENAPTIIPADKEET